MEKNTHPESLKLNGAYVVPPSDPAVAPVVAPAAAAAAAAVQLADWLLAVRHEQIWKAHS